LGTQIFTLICTIAIRVGIQHEATAVDGFHLAIVSVAKLPAIHNTATVSTHIIVHVLGTFIFAVGTVSASMPVLVLPHPQAPGSVLDVSFVQPSFQSSTMSFPLLSAAATDTSASDGHVSRAFVYAVHDAVSFLVFIDGATTTTTRFDFVFMHVAMVIADHCAITVCVFFHFTTSTWQAITGRIGKKGVPTSCLIECFDLKLPWANRNRSLLIICFPCLHRVGALTPCCT